MKTRDIERIKADERYDTMIATDQGRAELLAEFRTRCATSSLIALMEEALALPGDIAECGVFRGSTLWLMGVTAREQAPDKDLLGLDSFEGFPDGQVTDEDTSFFRTRSRLSKKFRYANDVPDRIERIFAAYGIKGRPLVGYFEKTLPEITGRRFCFIHLDSDTYASHIECLGALYDRVVPGGIVVFDDYQQAKWPGATKAIDEFFATRTEKPELSTTREQPAWYVRKPV